MSVPASRLLLALPALFSCAHGPEPIVHPHRGGPEAIFANAYLIETESGVIAIDATLTVSSARALRLRAEALNKPLLAVLLTHGHPDHYNGITELLAGDPVPVLATRDVDQVIRSDDAAKEALWKPTFGVEWPEVRTFPTRIVGDGETVSFDRVELTVHELGPGESHADSYWILEAKERAAFVGDAVFNGVHSYLSDGHSAAWLENLTRLEAELSNVRTIHGGHGDSGGRELFQAQRAYLELYRSTVAQLASGAPALSEESKAELTRVMKEHLGNDALEFLIALGADAVAAELANSN